MGPCYTHALKENCCQSSSSHINIIIHYATLLQQINHVQVLVWSGTTHCLSGCRYRSLHRCHKAVFRTQAHALPAPGTVRTQNA
jgi:hypothetical protein